MEIPANLNIEQKIILEMHSIQEGQGHQSGEVACYGPSEPQLHDPKGDGKCNCMEKSK